MIRLNIKILTVIVFLICNSLSSQDNIKDNYGNEKRSFIKHPLQQKQSSSFTSTGNEWQSVGPFGGDVVDLAINPFSPDTIFATAGIPYLSYDGGNSWSILDPLFELVGNGISSIEFNSQGALFAGGENIFGKVYRSLDNGSSWQQFVLPINSTVLDIVADPSDEQVVYCGVASLLGSTYNKVILKSIDGGQTWSAIDLTNVLPVGYSIVDISIDPNNNQTIFAIGHEGFSNCQVVASFDGGTTWEIRNTGLPTGKPYNALTIVDNIVYLAGGQLFGGQNVGVYKTTDFGLTWQNISSGFPNKVTNEIVYNPFDHNYLYAGTEGDGVYISSDGGNSWLYNTQGDGDKAAVRKIAVHPEDPMKLYCGMLSLAFGKSTNGGSSWSFSNYGIATLLINQVEVNISQPQTFLASFEAENSGGCFLTNNGGFEWELVSGLPGTRYSAVDISLDGTLYAWSNGPSSVAQEGLYKSTDGGESWVNMGPNIGSLFETEVFSVCVSEINPSLIFIGGNNFGANGWESMIYKTTDAGLTWVNVYKGSIFDGFKSIYIVPGTNDQVVYASYKSQDFQGGFLKSSDGGENWNEINNGIPANCKWAGSVMAQSENPDVVFGGIGGYGDIGGTVFKSVDGGLSWTGTSLSLNNYSRINDMIINPQNNSVLYLASSQSGVYISLDSGQNWEPSNENLPAISISSFSKPFDDGGTHKLLCSSTTNSTYSTLLYTPGFTTVYDLNHEEAQIEVYPIPIQDYLSVSVELFYESRISISVYNAIGAKVAELFEGKISSGKQTIELKEKFSEYQAGSYILEIVVNGKKFNKKIVIE